MEGIIQQMLMVDRVELQGLYERHQVVTLGNKDPVRLKKLQYTLANVIDALDMGKYISSGDYFRLPLGGKHFLSRLFSEIRKQGWDAPLDGNLSNIFRCDALDTVVILKITEQIPVIRSNIHYQIVRVEGDQGFAFLIEFGKILSKDFSRAAGIRVFCGKQNFWVHRQTDLNQLASLALKPLRRVRRLLCGKGSYRMHLIDRGKIAEK